MAEKDAARKDFRLRNLCDDNRQAVQEKNHRFLGFAGVS